MIVLPSSGDHPWRWADETDAAAAERAFAAAFPAIARHFAPHRAALVARQDQGRFFWELRSCAYYAEFARSKIFYQEIQYHPQYALDRSGVFANNKAFFVLSDDPWLLGCLNSPLMWWRNWRHLGHAKDEALTPQGCQMETVPIARPHPEAEWTAAKAVAALCAIQDEAHAARRLLAGWYRGEWGIEKLPNALRDPFALDDAAFAAALERRLDAMVNAAYGLSAEDVALLWRTAPPRMPVPPPA